MTRNMNDLDKRVRMFGGGGAALLGIVLFVASSSIVGVVLAVVGGILFATSLINFCPIYRAIGFSTYKQNPPQH